MWPVQFIAITNECIKENYEKYKQIYLIYFMHMDFDWIEPTFKSLESDRRRPNILESELSTCFARCLLYFHS